RNNFPDSPTSKTGKGSHIVYRYKDGVRNFQKREDLPDIDLRGDGGYILVEPSIHPSGHQYQWVKGKGLDDLPLAELPEIILAKSPEQKTPLRELYQGVPQGSRNDSLTRLAGSWARDGLSFEECLESAYLWNSKNAPPLSGREIECTVRSIYQKHHQENKTTDKQPMVLIPLGDLLKGEEEERVWLVDEIMLLGGFVGIGAKPKVGKSTLMRQLALNIAGGEPFLGKEVISGPVIYLALEDKLSEVKRHFRAMGARGHEKIYIYADAIPANVISQVKDAIENIRPVLLIIDPLFKFTKVKDTSAYAETLGALDSVLRLARKHEVTVSFTHHGTKADREGI
ncbi:MAG: AAA family ATPase, partial [Nitrospirota bacterium]